MVDLQPPQISTSTSSSSCCCSSSSSCGVSSVQVEGVSSGQRAFISRDSDPLSTRVRHDSLLTTPDTDLTNQQRLVSPLATDRPIKQGHRINDFIPASNMMKMKKMLMMLIDADADDDDDDGDEEDNNDGDVDEDEDK
ncbi:unnamed protein product [Pleuronectes platessa]|uniref:Uncharacterized protein n=1 Tax=Pleuronectes platessa TaxID=8262 RepID=A0A9N7YTL8_PLEPL|nr:unnamed protein product [Pleuronectes platessa]